MLVFLTYCKFLQLCGHKFLCATLFVTLMGGSWAQAQAPRSQCVTIFEQTGANRNLALHPPSEHQGLNDELVKMAILSNIARQGTNALAFRPEYTAFLMITLLSLMNQSAYASIHNATFSLAIGTAIEKYRERPNAGSYDWWKMIGDEVCVEAENETQIREFLIAHAVQLNTPDALRNRVHLDTRIRQVLELKVQTKSLEEIFWAATFLARAEEQKGSAQQDTWSAINTAENYQILNFLAYNVLTLASKAGYLDSLPLQPQKAMTLGDEIVFNKNLTQAIHQLFRHSDFREYLPYFRLLRLVVEHEPNPPEFRSPPRQISNEPISSI